MKIGTLLAMIFFVVFALLHLSRLLLGVTIVIDGNTVPLWVSVFAILLSGLLAALLWRDRQR